MTRVSPMFIALFAACADDATQLPIQAGSPRPRGIAPGDSLDEQRCISLDQGVTGFATSGEDEVTDVAVTPSGTILVSGFEDGARDGDDIVDSRGVVLGFARDLATVDRLALLDTDGTDSFESIAIAPGTGTVWAAARTSGVLPGTHRYGSFDAVLGTVSSTHGYQPVWRGYNSTPEHPRALAVAVGGHLAIAGDEARSMPDGTSTINPLLTRFSTTTGDASPSWSYSHWAPELEQFRAVDISETSIVIGATVRGSKSGMFIAARDLESNVQWRRELSSVAGDSVEAVRVLPDGDVLWAATSATQLGDTYHGGTDIVVGRVDGTTGEPEWIRQYGTSADDRAADLAIDAYGRIYAAGDVAELGNADVLLLVLDADGRELTSELWASDGDDVAAALAIDSCGRVVIGGYTNGELVGPAQGGRDAFVVVTRPIVQ